MSYTLSHFHLLQASKSLKISKKKKKKNSTNTTLGEDARSPKNRGGGKALQIQCPDSKSQRKKKKKKMAQAQPLYSCRMWKFPVISLYMINVWPDSLLFAATYGVLESTSTALFGPIVGQWVERLTYKKVLQLWLVTRNLSFIIAGGTVLVYSSLKLTNFAVFILLLVLTNISGAVGVLPLLLARS